MPRFYGKNANTSNEYVDIYNSWCHFAGDSYFTAVKYSKLLDDGTPIWGLANLTTADTWRTMHAFDFYSSTSTSSTITKVNCIAAGAFPTFSSNFYKLEENTYGKTTFVDTTLFTYQSYPQSYITIKPIPKGLKIGNDTHGYVEHTTFRDNAVPKFICFALQGAGGGGGYSGGTAGVTTLGDGQGGGAGGFVAGILKLDFSTYSEYRVYVGNGGRGGVAYVAPDNTVTKTNGATGTASKIVAVKSTGATLTLATANGGSGGTNRAEKDSTNTRVSGGKASVTTTAGHVFHTVTRKGGSGGAVYGKANATGCSSLTAKVTNHPSYTTLGNGSGLSLYNTWTGTKGGDQGDYNAPGGGGGSMLADGPAGGGFMGSGNHGSKGAGGSGARYTFLSGIGLYSKHGGWGGDGCVYFWY